MNKIFTVVATTGLLAAFAGSVRAQTSTSSTTFDGTVPSSCTVSTPATGTLDPQGTPATQLLGFIDAKVVCNDTSKTLEVALNSTGTVLVGSAKTDIGILGGTGNFSQAIGVPKKTITSVTSQSGDIATIRVIVNPPSNPLNPSLLQSGKYTVVVNATITP